MSFIWRDNDRGPKSPDETSQERNDFWKNQVGPLESFTRAFRYAFNYKGRSSRSEYWWFVLLSTVLNAVIVGFSEGAFRFILGDEDAAGVFVLSMFVQIVFYIATTIVWIALAVRRVRDAGVSPKLMLIYPSAFVLVIGSEIVKIEYQGIYIYSIMIFFTLFSFFMLFIFMKPSKSLDKA